MGLTASIDLATHADIAAGLVGLRVMAQLQMLRAIKAGSPLPPLYRSGVRYVGEKRGRERWQLPLTTLRKRRGDCEDLASYLAAEMRLKGIPAEAVIRQIKPGLKHALVMLPARGLGGRIRYEDPSARLGMKGAA